MTANQNTYHPIKGQDIEAANVSVVGTLDVTGAVAFSGDTQRQRQVASANGAITIKDGFVFLTKAGVAAMTLADPTAGLPAAGGDDGKELTFVSTTAQAHTVTIAGGLNGVGASADVGTFGGAIGDRFSVVAYNGKWYASGVNVNVTFA